MKRFVACAGLVTGGLLGLNANPAHAVGFQFTSECRNELGEIGAEVCREQAPTGDILLYQVVYGDQTRNDLTLVDTADIVSNDLWTGGDTGAASADMGDDATIGLSEENVTAEQIANDDPNQQSVLTNRNLNSIVDVEEGGKFAIDLLFEQAVDNVLVWERGMNSLLEIQALGADGETFGNTVKLGNRIKRNGDVRLQKGFAPWYDAGFAINTLEIYDFLDTPDINEGVQQVGSLGLSKFDFGLDADERITGIRLVSRGKTFNGPDWKVMGTIDPRYDDGLLSESVPEPFALAGLAVVGGAIAARRRRA
ncbi:MAG: exosortase-dependent surface protein XDP2 [Leptolyngbyaceae cyanobacterium]